MTPQAILRARFGELAASLGVKLSVRSQGGKIYFNIVGPDKSINQLIAQSFPGAWMTSAAGHGDGTSDKTYRLPDDQVERVCSNANMDPAWLEWRDKTVMAIARGIRADRAFDRLPVLADALEEAGCNSRPILDRCRQSEPSPHGCWVIDLILGPERRKPRN